jgi:hypothetical protein
MKIYSQKLLDELIAYSNTNSAKGKVMRIYWKCVKSGHIAWANAIELKYSHLFPKSDLVMAFGYSLMASKNLL